MEWTKKRVWFHIIGVVLLVLLIAIFIQKSFETEFVCEKCNELKQCNWQCQKACLKDFNFITRTNGVNNGTITCECKCLNPLMIFSK